MLERERRGSSGEPLRVRSEGAIGAGGLWYACPPRGRACATGIAVQVPVFRHGSPERHLWRMFIRIVGLCLIAAMGVVAPSAAQVRADPGVVIGNRIAVRVNVTLADDDTPYYPVRNLTVAFTRPASDTVTGRTDEAGVVTVLLTPGQYTVATVAPVSWKGEWYSWTLPVAVRADMPAIEFSGSNARRGAAGKQAGRAPATPPVQSAGEVASAASSGVRSGGPVR